MNKQIVIIFIVLMMILGIIFVLYSELYNSIPAPITPNSCTTNQYATAVTDTSGDLGCQNAMRFYYFNQGYYPCTINVTDSFVESGFNLTYTPTLSGNLSITVSFELNFGATEGSTFYMWFTIGTGTPPVCNQPQTGDFYGNIFSISNWAPDTGDHIPISWNFGVSNLGLNSQYWIDLAVEAPSANWVVSSPNLVIIEAS